MSAAEKIDCRRDFAAIAAHRFSIVAAEKRLEFTTSNLSDKSPTPHRDSGCSAETKEHVPFLDLPLELRNQIWDAALLCESATRIVVIDVDARIVPTKNLVSSLLATNKESRSRAQNFYNVKLEVYRRPNFTWLIPRHEIPIGMNSHGRPLYEDWVFTNGSRFLINSLKAAESKGSKGTVYISPETDLFIVDVCDISTYKWHMLSHVRCLRKLRDPSTHCWSSALTYTSASFLNFVAGRIRRVLEPGIHFSNGDNICYCRRTRYSMEEGKALWYLSSFRNVQEFCQLRIHYSERMTIIDNVNKLPGQKVLERNRVRTFRIYEETCLDPNGIAGDRILMMEESQKSSKYFAMAPIKIIQEELCNVCKRSQKT